MYGAGYTQHYYSIMAWSTSIFTTCLCTIVNVSIFSDVKRRDAATQRDAAPARHDIIPSLSPPAIQSSARPRRGLYEPCG